MRKSLTERLIAFFLLGIGPGEGDAGEGGEGGQGTDENLDLDNLDIGGDEGGEGGEGGDEGTQEDTQAIIARERARAEKAEREAREAREAAERARAQAPQPAQPSGPTAGMSPQEREQYDLEEKYLRDPQATPEQRWWAQNNRTIRQSAQESKMAVMAAADMNDRAAYRDLCEQSGPMGALAKRYAPKVEERLAMLRKEGKNVDRSILLKLMVGEDVMSGKVKAKAKPAAQPSGDNGRVHRQTVPVSRSDSRRAPQDERAKRRARLENQQI